MKVFLSLFCFAMTLSGSETSASFNSCEKIDGDCPTCKFPILEKNPVAKVLLSGVDELVASATRVEALLKNMSSPGSIQRFDDPKTGLHTSLFYFCCHSKRDVAKIKTALRAMNWSSFIVRYDSFGCNLDHDNKTVYLHALPSNQSNLFAWASNVEKTVKAYNVKIHHPRKSKFHMTLARVTRTYPTDMAIERLKNEYFGEIRLCSFVFENEVFYARDCPHGRYMEKAVSLKKP